MEAKRSRKRIQDNQSNHIAVRRGTIEYETRSRKIVVREDINVLSFHFQPYKRQILSLFSIWSCKLNYLTTLMRIAPYILPALVIPKLLNWQKVEKTLLTHPLNELSGIFNALGKLWNRKTTFKDFSVLKNSVRQQVISFSFFILRVLENKMAIFIRAFLKANCSLRQKNCSRGISSARIIKLLSEKCLLRLILIQGLVATLILTMVYILILVYFTKLSLILLTLYWASSSSFYKLYQHETTSYSFC